MLRRPRGWERVALAGVLDARRALALALPARRPRRPVARAAGARSSRQTPALLVEPWERRVYSVAFAAVAAAIALVVGGLAAIALARRPAGVVDGFVLLPLGASAVMLGFGFLIALRRGAGRLPRLVVARPRRAVARSRRRSSCGSSRRRCGRSTRRCARSRRRSARRPLRSRREIDLPLVGRAFAVAAGFAFAIALGEFGATVFVARAEQPTLPVAIFRFLGRPGETNQGIAAALAVVLAVIAVAPRCSPSASPTAGDGRSDGAGAAGRRCAGRARRAHAALAGVDLEVEHGETSPCSARAAAARRRCCGRSPGCSRSTRGR